MSNDTLVAANKELSAAKRALNKALGQVYFAQAEVSRLTGEEDRAFFWQQKSDKRAAKKTNNNNKKKTDVVTNIASPVGKPSSATKKTSKTKAKLAAAATAPSAEAERENKVFACAASEITGQPCASPSPAEAVKAAATLYNKRRYPTCKACKKAAKAVAKQAAPVSPDAQQGEQESD